jgi:hypothetical protein
MGCSFFMDVLLLQLLAPVNEGAGSIRGDARQRGFKTPRHCIWLSNFDRHVVWVLLRAPLGFKTALQVEITRKTLSY